MGEVWPEVRVHAEYLSSEDLIKFPDPPPDQREQV